MLLVVVTQAILFSFDVIHVGDEALDNRVPAFVFVILAPVFWSGVLILLLLAIGAFRRWRTRH